MLVPNDDATLNLFKFEGPFLSFFADFSYSSMDDFFEIKCDKCVQGRWKLPQGQTRGQEGRAGWAAEAGQHASHQIRIFSGLKRNFSPISRKYEITQISSTFMRFHQISKQLIFSKLPCKLLLSFTYFGENFRVNEYIREDKKCREINLGENWAKSHVLFTHVAEKFCLVCKVNICYIFAETLAKLFIFSYIFANMTD